MRKTVAMFNVDTQQPSEDGRCLVFRPRVAGPQICRKCPNIVGLVHLLRVGMKRA